MKTIKLFLLALTCSSLISCGEDTITVVQSTIESTQTCRATFITDIEFRYTATYFENGDVYVSCELTDFAINNSASSSKFYSSLSSTIQSINLECALFHEISVTQAGEFIFDVIGGIPGMTFLDDIQMTTTTYEFQPSECQSEFF